MKNIQLFLISFLIFTACNKEYKIQDIGSWSNKENIISGERNNQKWEGNLSMGASGGETISFLAFKKDLDSVIIERILISRIPIKTGKQKLENEIYNYNKIFAFYAKGYDDQFNSYYLDTTKTNTIDFTAINLQDGIITGNLDATFLYYYSLDRITDTVRFKNMEFEYKR